MPKLLKTQVQQHTDKIKHLILSQKAFAKPLAELYTMLRLQAKYEWMAQTYHLLLIYTNEQQTKQLYHPALLQALLSLGQMQEAQQIGNFLLQQNPNDPETLKLLKSIHSRKESSLPAYTPLATLSKYTVSKTAYKKTPVLPVDWQAKLAAITPDRLTALGYYAKYKQLGRAPKTYRSILRTQFDELTLCYLLQLNRSVIAVTGALLEMLLAIHLQEKYKINRITIGTQHKKVFDLNLHELISVYAKKNLLSSSTLRLCRAARMQRNLIHPGKELLEKKCLTPSGVQICFLAALEVIDELLA